MWTASREWLACSDEELVARFVAAGRCVTHFEHDSSCVIVDVWLCDYDEFRGLPRGRDNWQANFGQAFVERGLEVALPREPGDHSRYWSTQVLAVPWMGVWACSHNSYGPHPRMCPALLAAVNPMIARHRQEIGFAAKSAEADRIVRVTKAYLRGVLEPEAAAALGAALGGALTPDAIGHIVDMSAGDVAADVLAADALATRGYIKLRVPDVRCACADTGALAVCRLAYAGPEDVRVRFDYEAPYVVASVSLDSYM